MSTRLGLDSYQIGVGVKGADTCEADNGDRRLSWRERREMEIWDCEWTGPPFRRLLTAD